MLYKISKDVQIKFPSEEEQNNTYSLKIIGDNSTHYYLEVNGDLVQFTTDNPTAIEEKAIVNANIYDKLYTDRTLTYKNFLKNKVRNRIDKEVGDIYDLIADLDKRIGMIERLAIRFIKAYMDGEDISQNQYLQGYKPFLDQYIYAVENGLIVGRNDLENLGDMFNKIANRTTTVSKIVKTEYLDKLQ